MNSIVPGQIERLRKEKKLTQMELAERVKVNQKTISRLENGTHKKKIKSPILEALAKALDTTVEQLIGAPATKPVADEKIGALFGLPTQLNVRIDNVSRNAFTLVSEKYRISINKLVSLAPFLFVCAAEQSLTRRRARLSELNTRQQEVVALLDDFEHLNTSCWNNIRAEWTYSWEENSIKARDIFGSTLENDGIEEHLPYDYDEAEQNPFAIFLKDLSKETNGMAEFFSCSPELMVPRYKLSSEFLQYLIGDDEDAADEILSGHLALSKIPKEFVTIDDRLAWIKDHRTRRLEREKLAADPRLDEIIQAGLKKQAAMIASADK